MMTTEWRPEMTQPHEDEVPMFEVAAPVPVKVTRKPTGTEKPRWSRYKVKSPVKCDDCSYLLAMAEGVGPIARYALFRRKQGGSDLLLCEIHAQYHRDEDGLKPLERES